MRKWIHHFPCRPVLNLTAQIHVNLIYFLKNVQCHDMNCIQTCDPVLMLTSVKMAIYPQLNRTISRFTKKPKKQK